MDLKEGIRNLNQDNYLKETAIHELYDYYEVNHLIIKVLQKKSFK